MMLICDASVIVDHDRRTPGLFNAPLHMEYDNNDV